MDAVYEHDQYLVRREVFTIAGARFQIFDAEGNQLFYSKQKAFKLKEDIRIYSDKTLDKELLLIKSRHVVDFSAAYDVVDSQEGKKVGALRRKGFRSILKDSWELLDASDRILVAVQEDSMALALVRRFIGLIPQTFHASLDGRTLVTYKQGFNPFVQKLGITIEPGARDVLDPRLILAGGILLVAIEGRQG
jgi:uncharacterized protein YxjI